MCHTSRGWLFAAAFTLSINVLADPPALFAADAAPAAPGQIVLRETILGPMPTDMRQLTITPDGTRVALIANVGSRVQVLIDGNEGPQFSQILPVAAPPLLGQRAGSTLRFSPDQTCLVYVASKDGSNWQMVVNHKPGPAVDNVMGAAFSPVGHRLAYLVRCAAGQAVIVDSTVGPAYPWVWLTEMAFSQDGKHLAYAMKTGEGTSGIHAVLDGQVGPGFANVGSLTLSPDGNHLAYIANTGNLYDNCVVVDGKAGPIFPVVRVPITFSADGSHYAYTAAPQSAKRQQKWVAVIDGQSSPEFDEVSVPTFSPDGKHTAYSASATQGQRIGTYAIVDGQRSLDYNFVGNFLYTPASQHLAYHADTNSGKQVVVLDGRESDAHQKIDPKSIQFSPDGKRLAFAAQDPDGFHAVVDGKTGPPHQAIEPGSLRFTPDGQHYHYKSRGYFGLGHRRRRRRAQRGCAVGNDHEP